MPFFMNLLQGGNYNTHIAWDRISDSTFNMYIMLMFKFSAANVWQYMHIL